MLLEQWSQSHFFNIISKKCFVNKLNKGQKTKINRTDVNFKQFELIDV
jgi:hypothetical protein